MTSRRIVTNVAETKSDIAVRTIVNEMLLHHYKSIEAMEQRVVWICEVCGAVHLAEAPACCDCCGAHAIVQQYDSHREIGNRW